MTRCRFGSETLNRVKPAAVAPPHPPLPPPSLCFFACALSDRNRRDEDRRKKQTREISHIVKALSELSVRGYVPHDGLLRNIISILLIDWGRMEVGGSGGED